MAQVPVLCSDLSVFREQLGEAGRYAPAGDLQAWSKAIIDCATLPVDQVASAQQKALAPDLAWRSFSQASQELLRTS